MAVSLEKGHAVSNDYLILDTNKYPMELSENAIRLICDRHFGIGSDGLLVGLINETSRNTLCKRFIPAKNPMTLTARGFFSRLSKLRFFPYQHGVRNGR